MIALLQSLGTKLTENICLYTEANGCARQYFNFLNKNGGRQSGTEERLDFNLLIATIIQYSVNATDSM